MNTPRSRSETESGTGNRGGAHRRYVTSNSTRWWVLASTIMLLVTGIGLATAELSSGPPPLQVAGKSAPPLDDTDSPTSADASPSPSSSSPSPSKDSKTSEKPSESEFTSEAPEDVVAPLVSRTIKLVNKERVSAGCGKVENNDRLAAASDGHSHDMAANDYLDHTSRDGRTFSDRAAEHDYDAAIAENIAAGQSSAEAVMDSWMDSKGHRANILNCDAKAIGLGVSEADDGTLYWTQMFGSQ